MNERSIPQRQRVGENPEYKKFAVLLVATLFAILVIAIVSSWMIGRVAPVVLGLEGLPTGHPGQAAQETPASEEAPVAEPNVLIAPETALETDGAAAAEGAAPSETVGEGLRHEVQSGQTLFQISELYGVSVQEIAAANHLVNPMQLEAGAILIIPQPR